MSKNKLHKNKLHWLANLNKTGNLTLTVVVIGLLCVILISLAIKHMQTL
jgi:hypothetical protein